MQIYLKIYLVIHIICKQKHLLIHPSTLSSLHFGIYLYLHGHGLEDFVQIIPTGMPHRVLSLLAATSIGPPRPLSSQASTIVISRRFPKQQIMVTDTQ